MKCATLKYKWDIDTWLYLKDTCICILMIVFVVVLVFILEWLYMNDCIRMYNFVISFNLKTRMRVLHIFLCGVPSTIKIIPPSMYLMSYKPLFMTKGFHEYIQHRTAKTWHLWMENILHWYNYNDRILHFFCYQTYKTFHMYHSEAEFST